MKGNIIFNKTLEEYNKKYGRRSSRLLKLTKQDISKFNKRFPFVEKDYLLKGHKWWLIDDTYYEQPKKTNKVILASLLSLFLVSGTTLGVGEGVYHWFSGGGDTPTPGPEPGPVPPVEDYITITFNAMDGSWSSEKTKDLKILKKERLGKIYRLKSQQILMLQQIRNLNAGL